MNVATDEIDLEIGSNNHERDIELDRLHGELMEGADVGLAVFNKDLTLLEANARYLDLCGYAKEDVPAGTALETLIELSLTNQGMSRTDIKRSIATTLLRLKVGGTHKFRFETSAGKYIAVTRHCNPNGVLIETVNEISAADLQSDGRNQLEQLAEAAHQRMMHALDAMADGFALFDSNDRLVVYNQRFVDLNPTAADVIKPGVQSETILRLTVRRRGVVLQDMSPDAFVKWKLHQHFNPGEPHEHQLADGRWIRTLESQADDGCIVGTSTDITELKNRELQISEISGALDQKRDQLNTAMNNMIQGLCMFDANQRLLLCNKQYLAMYGFSPEVVKPGISLSDIMRYSISLGNYRDEDAQAALHARHDPDKLKKRTVIKQYLRDGRVMAVMNEPMPNGGSIATYEDITVVERHEANLVAYMKKLERSNRELVDFAYVASHDLQEPLRKIEAFGDRLVRKYSEILPDDGKMFIDRMQNAATRMRLLINDLLSYSRVTTKAKPFVQVDLNDILEGVLSDLQVTIQNSSGRVEVSDLPVLVADPTQMRQLFQNLLSNALKFRKPDVDPVVKVSAEEGSITNEEGNVVECWRFKIADNGIGFENQYKDQIFTIFQRLNGRMEYEGTGIGLATCRKIVERHEGNIDADGQPDIGATFIIDLPKEQANFEDELE